MGCESLGHITCLLCGHRASTLCRHLKAVHKVTADWYRSEFPEARIRSVTCEENRRAAITKAHKANPTKGAKKQVVCSGCGETIQVSRFASSSALCGSCKSRSQESYWLAKQEGQDYVTCVGCGHRAENLTSHIQNTHPEWVGVYPGQVVALCSSVRDKSSLKGKKLSALTRKRMSVKACRWNKGHTKLTHSSLARAAQKMKGKVPWSVGLSKDTHPSLRSTSEKLKQYAGEKRPWSNGLQVRLAKHDLIRFSLRNGKIAIGSAAEHFGHSPITIRKECQRHGLSIAHGCVKQLGFLTLLSSGLGQPFVSEWTHPEFVNPKSGRRFRFDGYFPELNLVVEFHGYQHYTYPNVYTRDWASYLALRSRDGVKEALVRSHSVFKYFVVREDEPYTDWDYLCFRLCSEGILE